MLCKALQLQVEMMRVHLALTMCASSTSTLCKALQLQVRVMKVHLALTMVC